MKECSLIFDIMNFCFYQVLMNDILIERFSSVEDTRQTSLYKGNKKKINTIASGRESKVLKSNMDRMSYNFGTATLLFLSYFSSMELRIQTIGSSNKYWTSISI